MHAVWQHCQAWPSGSCSGGDRRRCQLAVVVLQTPHTAAAEGWRKDSLTLGASRCVTGRGRVRMADKAATAQKPISATTDSACSGTR